MKQLFLACALLISCASFGQRYTYRNMPAGDYPAVHLGPIDAAVLTSEQIVANPTLNCKEDGCEVLSYEVRISRRGRDFYGPYFIKGASFNDEVKDIIQHIDVARGTIYFENIHVKYKGQDIVLPDEYSIAYKR